MQQAAKIVDERELIEWLGRVASGEETEDVVSVDSDGQPHGAKKRPAIRDRLRAVAMLLDRADGKPTVRIQADSDAFERIIEIVPRLTPEQWYRKYGRAGDGARSP